MLSNPGNCGFGHIYWRNPYWKTSFFVQWGQWKNPEKCIWFTRNFIWNESLFTCHINPFMQNVENRPNILLKSWGVNTARFLKYVWPFFNIMDKRVNNVSDTSLNLSWRRCFIVDLLCKSMDWFLYDQDFRHRRVKSK